MKKWIAVLLLPAMLLCLGGCSEEAEAVDPIAQAYIDSAKPYVEAGDYASAILILEDGAKNVTDAALTDYLAQVKAMQATAPTETAATDATQPTDSTEPVPTEPPTTAPAPTEPPTTAPAPTVAPSVDYSTYAGTWGDGELTLTLTGEKMELYYTSVQGNGMRIAEISEHFYLSQITNGSVYIPYEDSWFNTGLCILTFLDGQLQVEIKDVTSDPNAMWGFSEGIYIYQRASTQNQPQGYSQDEIERMVLGTWLVYHPVEEILLTAPIMYVKPGSSHFTYYVCYPFPENKISVAVQGEIGLPDSLYLAYDDDGYGNSGEITISYADGCMVVTSKVTYANPSALLVLPEGTFVMDAHMT